MTKPHWLNLCLRVGPMEQVVSPYTSHFCSPVGSRAHRSSSTPCSRRKCTRGPQITSTSRCVPTEHHHFWAQISHTSWPQLPSSDGRRQYGSYRPSSPSCLSVWLLCGDAAGHVSVPVGGFSFRLPGAYRTVDPSAGRGHFIHVGTRLICTQSPTIALCCSAPPSCRVFRRCPGPWRRRTPCTASWKRMSR